MIANNVLYFPWKRKPKLILSLGSYEEFVLGLSMYQPSSLQGKFIKYIFFLLYPFLKFFKGSLDDEKLQILTDFQDVVVQSFYFSTDQQKYVMLAKCERTGARLIIKVSNTPLGISRLKRELSGYHLFRSLNLTHFKLHTSHSANNKFSLTYMHEIFDFNIQNTNYVCNLVSQLRRGLYLSPSTHPRIQNIFLKIKKNLYEELLDKLYESITLSNSEYEICYEHGDLAPWNCYDINGEHGVFDFEYFEEDGIEGFDLLRYAYSIALLKGKNLKERLQNIDDFYQSIGERLDSFLLIFFLCDEINRKAEENLDYAELENYLQGVLLG